MLSILTLMNRLHMLVERDEEGQALAEYGLLLALIAVVCVAALIALGTGISSTLGSITGHL